MSDLFGNHIVGFSYEAAQLVPSRVSAVADWHECPKFLTSVYPVLKAFAVVYNVSFLTLLSKSTMDSVKFKILLSPDVIVCPHNLHVNIINLFNGKSIQRIFQ